MTLSEAIAQQPVWLGWWLNWMLIGVFVLPVLLLFWRQSRVAGIAAILAAVLAGLGTGWLYSRLGYVKLLGLPHVLLWTPLAFYLLFLLRWGDLPKYPRWIMVVVLTTILVSLAFDYSDTVRYLLGNRAPAPGTI